MTQPKMTLLEKIEQARIEAYMIQSRDDWEKELETFYNILESRILEYISKGYVYDDEFTIKSMFEVLKDFRVEWRQTSDKIRLLALKKLSDNELKITLNKEKTELSIIKLPKISEFLL